jgi:Asp-tRNA(Asn)/Glu-tRNA(Gln) amidotransferase C subunit
MKKLPEIIVTVIVTAILTFLIDSILNSYSEPIGVYENMVVEVDSRTIGVISLENKTKNIQNGLIFHITGCSELLIKTTGFANSSTVQSTSDSSAYLITLTNILPESKNNIIIKGLSTDSELLFSNAKEKKFISHLELINTRFSRLKNGLLSSLVYGVFAGLFYLIISLKYGKEISLAKEEVNKLNSNLSSIDTKLSRVEETEKQGRELYTKAKLILLAKNRDYEKELSFWKNIISKIIVEDEHKQSKKLFEYITKELKTFGTKENVSNELSMAEYLEKIFRKEK